VAASGPLDDASLPTLTPPAPLAPPSTPLPPTPLASPAFPDAPTAVVMLPPAPVPLAREAELESSAIDEQPKKAPALKQIAASAVAKT